MLIKAKYEGENVYLNTDYVMDVFDADKLIVKMYTIDLERGGYEVTQAELKRWLDSEEENE